MSANAAVATDYGTDCFSTWGAVWSTKALQLRRADQRDIPRITPPSSFLTAPLPPSYRTIRYNTLTGYIRQVIGARPSGYCPTRMARGKYSQCYRVGHRPSAYECHPTSFGWSKTSGVWFSARFGYLGDVHNARVVLGRYRAAQGNPFSEHHPQ